MTSHSTDSSKNVLDKYRVIAQLGRGGMADVYLAAASGPGGFSKLLVVKVLQGNLARESEFRDMFGDEARLAARLNHPNIVQTYEVGESHGRHYIAMEYLEGQPLSQVSEAFSKEGQLSLEMSLRIIMDALSGLHYAHELNSISGEPLGVVHRDITPQNIFVTYEGQIKLVDFGIAKALDSSTHTKIGTVKGKVSYMAPEQARGEEVDRRADLFSMGVLLWELLSGRRLWEGLTDIAVVGRLVQGEIPNLSELRPDLPKSLARLTMRALDPTIGNRPKTALEFQRLLESEFDTLGLRLPTRRMGELMRDRFRDERALARQVVAKQLERLARTTSSGATPAGGWRLDAPAAGDMPILGEGSAVHDAVTALHTEITGAELDTSPPLSPHHIQTTNMTDAALISQSRTSVWIAVAAVGLAGLALGLGQPWNGRPATKEAPAAAPPLEQSPPALPLTTLVAEKAIDNHAADCLSTNKPLVELTGEISEDATLACDKDYLLRFTTYVSAGATLRIEAGTRILGDKETKGVLVVQPGAQIKAIGTKDSPIVFTSASEESARKAGDWGGVILLGEAPINLKDAKGRPMPGNIEGITSGGEYGGTNPNDSSGVLSHVRIEYSGTEIAPNNEINGLTLGAVGRGTVIDHVQVRHTTDDCFEFFGGTVDAKYLACQFPGDDAFDWDYGFTGRLQFLVAQSNPRLSGGSNGFEGDNDPNGTTNGPVSHPQIYNATMCGKNRRLENKEHYGILLRKASRVRIRNSIFTGYAAGLDVRDNETKANIAASVFYDNKVENLAYAEDPKAQRGQKMLYNDDDGFDERVYLQNPDLKIDEGDPRIGNCFDERNPGMKPAKSLTSKAALPPNDGFFDSDATYVGAFRDQKDDWDAGAWMIWGQ